MTFTFHRVTVVAVVVLLCLAIQSNAQEPADSLVKKLMLEGIDFAENGNFDLALITYHKARNLDPKDGFINYEIALAHYELENKEKALKYARVAAKEDSEHGIQACILSGTVLDESDKYRKAIKTFEKGTKRFGDYYLIHYNLGITALSHKDYQRAADAFEMAIRGKLDHVDSHMGLARSKSAQSKHAETLYPLLFYMLLAPDKSEGISDRIDVLMDQQVEVKFEKKPKKTRAWRSSMQMANLFLSMFGASRMLDSYSDLSDFDRSLKALKGYLSQMGKMNFDEFENVYASYYIPFFAAIADSEHMEAFYHFIRQESHEQSEQWVKTNYERIELFFIWLDAEAPRPPEELFQTNA
ncbi:MAG: tetratricopeptide repeat protein [Salibacteraceae bacterium]